MNFFIPSEKNFWGDIPEGPKFGGAQPYFLQNWGFLLGFFIFLKFPFSNYEKKKKKPLTNKSLYDFGGGNLLLKSGGKIFKKKKFLLPWKTRWNKPALIFFFQKKIPKFPLGGINWFFSFFLRRRPQKTKNFQLTFWKSQEKPPPLFFGHNSNVPLPETKHPIFFVFLDPGELFVLPNLKGDFGNFFS